jgi:hypothetical protein
MRFEIRRRPRRGLTAQVQADRDGTFKTMTPNPNCQAIADNPLSF